MDFSFLIAIMVIALAILLLIWIWLTSPPNEQNYLDEFDKFIQRSIKEFVFNHRLTHNNLNEIIKEVSLDEPLQLTSNQQLLVFGLNHSSTIRSPWILCTDVHHSSGSKHYEISISGQGSQNFWMQKFSTWPERESFRLPERVDFEIYENVWSARSTLLPRAFQVPMPGNLNFSIDPSSET